MKSRISLRALHGRNRAEIGASVVLGDRSHTAVIGGGPAGSFFGFFFLTMAQRAGLDLQVDLYEPRDFSLPGPTGCNMCGGVISESLVQALAAEGVNLPLTVVERGIDSYVLHMDEGCVRIETPLREKRIAAVHRGAGPRGIREMRWRSFDGYLLDLAVGKGAHLVRGRVVDVRWHNGRPEIKIQDDSPRAYDLVVVATGVNTSSLKIFEKLGLGYTPPQTRRTYISEFCLGQETVGSWLGNSMHVFLPNIPRLEFAALIPKGDYATLCLLGRDIDGPLMRSFLDAREVRKCLPPECFMSVNPCHCSPRISVQGAIQPFGDRIVFIGDCGVSRLYKDGIGCAYRTAKAAAVTAIFQGVSTEAFRRHYWPVCQAITRDNNIGKVVFAIIRRIQRTRCARRGVLRMLAREQQEEAEHRHMSTVLWDTFSGSATYREVFLRSLRPSFLGRFLWDTASEIGSPIKNGA